jgi:hypothetical protein
MCVCVCPSTCIPTSEHFIPGYNNELNTAGRNTISVIPKWDLITLLCLKIPELLEATLSLSLSPTHNINWRKL